MGRNKQLSDLSQKQIKLIPLLITTGNIEKACSEAGISRNTYYLWIKDDDFKDELRSQMEGAYFDNVNGLKGLTCKAINVLGDLLNSDDEQVKVKVATTILDKATRLIDDLERKERDPFRF